MLRSGVIRRGVCATLLEHISQLQTSYGARLKRAIRQPPAVEYGCVEGSPSHAHVSRVICPRSVLAVPGDGIKDALQRQRRHGVAADVMMLDLRCRRPFSEAGCGSVSADMRDRVLSFLRSLEKCSGDGNARCFDHTDEGIKQATREESREALNGEGEKRIRWIVLVNSPELDPQKGFLDMELVGLLGDLIEGVVLPSVTTKTYDLVCNYIHPDHTLWAAFDTPLSVLQAADICSQGHYRYAVVSQGDLMECFQCSRGGPGGQIRTMAASGGGEAAGMEHIRSLPVLYSVNQVLVAARAHGMYLLDDAFNDISDSTGFRCNIQQCRALGFDGKVVLRPMQTSVCHEVFAPTAEEVEWARSVLYLKSMEQCAPRVGGSGASVVAMSGQRCRAELILARYSAEHQCGNRCPKE
uniref:Uncharacterized protein TCIL3000_8_6730 n=1 Tax=Trypanosoma congolense (strain IL3000) TaxID=1068625 RepID=G0UST3_TRYCI|nr:unnamed protein product [Trypanosoma congolense IL3000]